MMDKLLLFQLVQVEMRVAVVEQQILEICLQ
jgi:hypothetical protein